MAALFDPGQIPWGTTLDLVPNVPQQARWMLDLPGPAMFCTGLSFCLAGEALDDLHDPRRVP